MNVRIVHMLAQGNIYRVHAANDHGLVGKAGVQVQLLAKSILCNRSRRDRALLKDGDISCVIIRCRPAAEKRKNTQTRQWTSDTDTPIPSRKTRKKTREAGDGCVRGNTTENFMAAHISRFEH